MNRSTRSLVTCLALAVWLWWAADAVQAQEAMPADPTLTAEQVANSFSRAGFQVGQAHTRDWTSPPVTTLQIRDNARDRLLLVQIYANPTTAQAARLQAQAHEQALNRGNLASAESPHLVEGHGASLWNGNVALVQTTQSRLDQLFQLQGDCANGLYVDPNVVPEPSLPSDAVDLDFRQALDQSVVNL